MKYRYSGHGTFPCRYSWLPKVVRQIIDKPDLFTDEDDAMVRLGVGKNMVRAIRFWADATQVAESKDRGRRWVVTEFGRSLLAPQGFDEYLEDVQTLWLIHWKLSTNKVEPLFAWHCLLNRWHKPSFTRTDALTEFRSEAKHEEKPLSDVTLEEHISIFLHTYAKRTEVKRELVEESLDCPLVELALVEEVGERLVDSGRREPIYAFRVEEKPDISHDLFLYCLNEFWTSRHDTEKTLPFSEIAIGECSPGQVFKLPEFAVRGRLENLERESNGVFAFEDSMARQQVIRNRDVSQDVLLKRVFRGN